MLQSCCDLVLLRADAATGTVSMGVATDMTSFWSTCGPGPMFRPSPDATCIRHLHGQHRRPSTRPLQLLRRLRQATYHRAAVRDKLIICFHLHL